MQRMIVFLLLFTSALGLAQDQVVLQTGNKITPSFIKNDGQIIDQNGHQNTKVLYLLNTPGLNVQLRTSGFSYDVYETEKGIGPAKTLPSEKFYKKRRQQTEKSSAKRSFHRIDIDFLGANPEVKILEYGKTEANTNYYNISEAEEGITKVSSFRKIRYVGLYPNIDLEFFIPEDPEKPVEYNFIIHPQGKIGDIKMKIEGAETNLLSGSIEMDLAHGKMKEIIPASWFQEKNEKTSVGIEYFQLKTNVFGFCYSEEKKNKTNATLTIDPTPVREWATYFGGEEDESYLVGDVATDTSGNVFIVGHTESNTNIATTGSAQTSFDTWRTGFIAKFNKDGNLLWSTYYGREETTLRSITIDLANKIIIGGHTSSSTNISTPGSHQEYLDGHDTNYFDGLVSKFSNDGILEWGTYYGGELMEVGAAVATDKEENIYFAGFTESHESITTPGSFMDDREVSRESLGFLAKFDKNGNRQWGTFYDGDGIWEIEADENGNVFMVGHTEKRTGIASPGAYQETFSYDGGSWTDAFLVKFTPEGQRAWGTYFGGYDYEFGYGLAVDSRGDVIIGGNTRSNEQIGSAGAHQEEKGGAPGDFDSFLAKFSNGGDFLWSTYYGGENTDGITDVAVDANNNIFAFGATLSTTGIATEDVYQENFNSDSDLFLAKFNPSGERLWGTYYGGNNSDQSLTMDIGEDGAILLMGYTYSTQGLTTPGAYQEQNAGYMDVILIKLRDCLSSVTAEAPGGVCEGEDIEFTATGGISYLWTGPNGFSSTDADPVISAADPADSGTYSVLIVSGVDCDDTRTFDVVVSPAPVANPVREVTACETEAGTGISKNFDLSEIESQLLGGQTGMEINYYTANGTPLPEPLPHPYTNTVANRETLTARVAAVGNPGCYAETNFDLVVNPLPQISSVEDIVICDTDTDGIAETDLNAVAGELTGKNRDLKVNFFDTDRNSISLSLEGTYTNSTAFRETITAQLISEDTGCYSETDFDLLINPAPMAHVPEDLIGCDDDNDGISEYFDLSEVEAEVLQGQTGLELKYFRSDGSEITEITSPYTNFQPNEETLLVRVSTPETGCYAETYLTLKTSAAPVLNTPATIYSCDEGNGVGNFDTSAWTENLIGNQPGLKVTYYSQNGDPLPTPLPAFYTNAVANAEKITVKVQNELNSLCSSETNFDLIINKKEGLFMEDTYNLCDLEPFLNLSPGGSFDTWEWKDANGTTISNTAEASLSAAGNYTVTVSKTENGVACENSYSFRLNRSQLPAITEVKYQEWSSGNYIEIMAGGDGDLEYSIDGVNFQDSNYFGKLSGGAYTVFARDKYGCGKASSEVVILDYPKFFSPNNDGHNDLWQIKGLSTQPETKIHIFDRFGKLIKELSSKNRGWDGTFNGKPMPADDYWFSTGLEDGRVFNGHFSLVL